MISIKYKYACVNRTRMMDRIDIDPKILGDVLADLCNTPGPTQACVKLSERDIRIEGNFPLENKIAEIVSNINEELGREGKGCLQIIRYMGNLLIISGLAKFTKSVGESKILEASELGATEVEKIKSIPVTFGAHLDEITYIVSRKMTVGDEDVWEVLPICNPPKRIEKIKPITAANGAIKLFIGEIIRPKCVILGYRRRELEIIGSGKLNLVWNTKDLSLNGDDIIIKDIIGKEKIVKLSEIIKQGRELDTDLTHAKLARYLHLKVEKLEKDKDIREGDMVIMAYERWDEDDPHVLESNALDDRVGCIATIYAVKELGRRNICSKAVLTSSEEGVPLDVSWGRLVQSCYEKFCENDGITLVCDGINGADIGRINYYGNEKEIIDFTKKETKGIKELKEAIVIPYTANGKGGGDLGIFSLMRDEILPNLSKVYPEEKVAATTTDYTSRSFEVKIMDRWTLIGFVQWTCGIPRDLDSVCHNKETVNILQIINIIRTLVGFASYIHSFSESPTKLN